MKLNGWAVESRVYAEDPYRNFLPSIGRLTRYRPPAETSLDGVTVRNDTGVTEGGEISIYYDPMIAKLVTHAPTRDAAIAAQANALDAFVIDGIRHNIPFLVGADGASALAGRQALDRLHRRGVSRRLPCRSRRRARWPRRSRAVAAAIDHVLGERKRRISGQMTGREVTRERRRVVRLGDDLDSTLDVGARGRGHRRASSSAPTATSARRACWCRRGSRAIRCGAG